MNREYYTSDLPDFYGANICACGGELLAVSYPGEPLPMPPLAPDLPGVGDGTGTLDTDSLSC